MEGEDEKARSPFQRSVGFYRNKTGRESDWEVTNVGDRVVVEKTKDDTQIWDGKGKPVGFLGYFDETLVETHTKRKEGDAPLGEKEGGVEKEPTGFLEYLDGPSLKAHLKLAGDHMRRAKESKRESTPVMSKIKKENKNDRCMSVDRDWRRESQGKEKMEDLMRLRRIAREFYESVTNHFHWFEPVMSDHSRVCVLFFLFACLFFWVIFNFKHPAIFNFFSGASQCIHSLSSSKCEPQQQGRSLR